MTQSTAQINPAISLHQEALTLLRAGQLQDGIAVLEKALEINPGSGDLHNDMATALWQTGKVEQAGIHFDKAIKLESKRPHIFNNYGYFLLTSRQPAAAEKMFGKAIELKPDFAEAMANLGQCLQTLGRMDDAERVYIAAIRLNPAWPETHHNIGTLYTQKKMIAHAEAAQKKTIELAPRHFRAWYELGRIHRIQNRMEECLACLYQAKAINPLFQPAWTQLINILNQRGEKENAERMAEEAMKLIPGSPSIILEHATSLRSQKRHQEALDLLEKMNDKAQEWPPIQFERAHNYAALSRTDEAFTAYAKANLICKTKAPSLAPYIRVMKDSETLFNTDWIQSWTSFQPEKLNIKLLFIIRYPGMAHVSLPPEFLDRSDIEHTHAVPAIENAMQYLSNTLGRNYPAGIATLTLDQMSQARQIYIESLRAAGLKMTAGTTIIDTSPLNIIHAGLIFRLLPEANFLMLLSHPYDDVLTGFMELQAAGDTALRSFDLVESARLYGQSFRLWEHYRAMLPLSVASQQAADASSRWKIYGTHIQPALPVLEPWAEKYGYPLK